MPQVSLFGKVDSIYNPQHLDLIECLEQTRDGKWEDLVLECRLIKDKKQRDLFKDTMPRITFSGKFNVRADKSLDEHSGVINMDFDGLENISAIRKKIQEDKYIFAVFVSTSGNGLRVLFRIEPDKQREAFLAISKYMYDNYELVADPAGGALSRSFIVSFDPFLYLNPNYEKVPIYNKYIKETPIKKIANFVHTEGDFGEIVKQIVARRVNICETYADYLKVCFAISEQFGEAGRQDFHAVAQFSQKYNFKKSDKQYDYCLKARGSGERVNISTFYYLAKVNNINIVTEQTKIIVRNTKNGKRAGLKKEQIIENLKKFNNIENSQLVVDALYDSNTEYMDEEESILEQLEMFISNNYSLLMNDVTGFLEDKGKRLTQSDLNSVFISAKKMITKLDYPLMMRLLKSDFIPSYNPFFDFFESDGIPVQLPAIPIPLDKEPDCPLIDKLAKSIVNDNPSYTLFFVRKWIVSIISSAHKVHSPLLLCLLGGQNTGKTEWFRRLLPAELRDYYAESKLDKEKDDEILMTENLVIMDDELGGKSKSDNLKLKNLTSKQYFSLRRPYADHNEKILRLAVLCGTSNSKKILTDSTGNRRIIPIEVLNIDKELYNSIDKKELFLEAFRLYKEGFDWRITQADISFLNKDQEDYQMEVAENELILRYFAPEDNPNSTARRFSTTDIKVELERLTGQKLSLVSIGVQLENNGFQKKSTRISATKTPKLWLAKRVNREEMDGLIYKTYEDENTPF